MVASFSRRKLITSIGVGGVCFSATSPAASNDTKSRLPGPITQPISSTDLTLIERAFEMRQRALDLGDQPYGAVVARAGLIIGQSSSRVLVDGDPTAHAEMSAIRDASRRTGSRHLNGSVLFSSSRPCPMCEAAAYWAGIERMVFGRKADDAGAPQLCR